MKPWILSSAAVWDLEKEKEERKKEKAKEEEEVREGVEGAAFQKATLLASDQNPCTTSV